MSIEFPSQLTGQASEDEPPNNHERRQQRQPPREPSQSRSQQLILQQNESTINSDTLRNTAASAVNRSNGGILSYLPCPIDLWNSRTPISLLLLPIVFIIYTLLQLPLNYNASVPTHIMTLGEWSGRAQDVDKLSEDLNTVKEELGTVEGDHVEIRGMVTDLQRRLAKMKERREGREERMRMWQERDEEREREEEHKQQLLLEDQKQQGGVVREGPISTATMVKALAVATFAGKQNVVDDAKKGN